MGITIEVYRSRIGLHNIFTHCRNRLHCLKGILWNQILIMFYLNIFYIPCLKSQLNKEKSKREVCQWYAQMIYYHAVYVPVLLRLSNDARLQSLLCAEKIFSAHFWMCPRKIYRIHTVRAIFCKKLYL